MIAALHLLGWELIRLTFARVAVATEHYEEDMEVVDMTTEFPLGFPRAELPDPDGWDEDEEPEDD